MPQLDKLLSIEEVEAYTNYLGGEYFDKFLPVRIAKQLADTIRDNERLREALKNIAAATGGEEWDGDMVMEAISFEAESAIASCKHLVVEKE